MLSERILLPIANPKRRRPLQLCPCSLRSFLLHHVALFIHSNLAEITLNLVKSYEIKPCKERGHAGCSSRVFGVGGCVGPEREVEDECKKDETGAQTDRTGREEDREDADCLVTYEKIEARGMDGLTMAAC
jgi:hypothetical protein